MVDPHCTHFCGAQVPDQPLVSIVMPVRNGMAFVEQAVASVAALRDTIALELVVADGGSTDGTREFVAQVPFARGVSAPDGGIYDGVNRALSMARGRYVQWLNADDVLGLDFLPRAAALLDGSSSQVGFVLGTTVFVDEAGVEIGQRAYDAEAATDFAAHAQGTFYNINSALFRRDLLVDNGPFAQRQFPRAADREFEFRLCLCGCEARVIGTSAYTFRRHDASLTGAPGERAANYFANAGVFDHWARQRQIHASWRASLIASRIDAGLMASYLSFTQPLPQQASVLRQVLYDVMRHPVPAARVIAKRLRGHLLL